MAPAPGEGRPLASDPAVRRARLDSLGEPDALGNSLSSSEYPALRRISGSRFAALSSVCDPGAMHAVGRQLQQLPPLVPLPPQPLHSRRS